MVLGLMDFLLGGKKKTKVPKQAQVATPAAAEPQAPAEPVQPAQPSGAAELPDGANKPTENVEEKPQENVEFVDSKKEEAPKEKLEGDSTAKTKEEGDGGGSAKPAADPNPVTTPSGSGAQPQPQPGSGHKKSVSEAINKIHSEIKSSNERLTSLVTDIKTIENNVTTMGHRIDTLEEGKKQTDDKLSEIDDNMTKFLSLYELINNQYNPFVDKDSMPQKLDEMAAEKIKVAADGSSHAEGGEHPEGFDKSELDALGAGSKGTIDISKKGGKSSEDLDSALLVLDTVNIEEAAGDAVPLTTLKNNTNSLVIILSWLEYLIKKVGIDETRSSLRYYTEVLRWITPEVYFELDKYLRGMKDVEVDEGTVLGVRDHIVSLYFISKLNEKVLDEKLTNAVLQIIKS